MNYKTLAALTLSTLALAACSSMNNNTEPKAEGGEQDAHGCYTSAGYAWSQLLQKCVQPFNEAQIRMNDPNNATLGVYLVLSEDMQQAEVYGVDFGPGTIWQAAKGGYVSDDGQWHAQRNDQGDWELRKN